MNQEYTQRLQKIEAELERWLDTQLARAEQIFPGINLGSPESCSALFEPLKDIISRGGKRWRPLLMTLVCETLVGGNNRDDNRALPLAPLIEFSHNASLIHDDIEDDSEERRGKPAVHHIYGVDTAINSGSFFYFLSLCCIESYKGTNKEFVYKLWGEYMRKLHLGQAKDISWHRDITYVPSIEDYYSMCAMKTGCLARLAAELGVYAACENEEAARHAGAAAEKLGIGFQILDDVKNLTAKIPGKKFGDDIVEGKKSLPLILYLHKFPQKREWVFYCISEAMTNGSTVPEVKDLIEAMTQGGVLTEAEEKAHELIQSARDSFNSPKYGSISASEEGRALLDGLISFIS